VTVTPRIALIAAVADNRVIGHKGAMPWRLATDLKRFKQLTLGKPVIMGRRTWESLRKPLSDRLNIVLSANRGFVADGGIVAHSLDEAIAIARDWVRGRSGDEAMVAGGGEIYAEAIGMADRLYITHVRSRPEGDAHFPEIDAAMWREVSRESYPAGEQDTEATDFLVYERRTS
jgi:dihydrofolate reductase